MTILPQLERDLFKVANRRLSADASEPSRVTQPGAHRRTRWRRFRRRARTAATPLTALISILVTVAVAAAALTALSHRHVPASAAAAASVNSSRAQLIAAFGVLRRPQAKADREPIFMAGLPLTGPGRVVRPFTRPPPGVERALTRWGDPKLDQSLVRVVQIPAWHATLAFEPATFQPSASTPHRTEGLNLNLRTGLAQTIPPATDDGTGPRPTSVGAVLAHGLALIGGLAGRDGVVVVPDGVARVTLGPIQLIDPPAKVDTNNFDTITATVRDNVAAFQMPMLTASSRRAYSGLFGVPAVAQAIWFDTTGNVIKRTTTHLDLIIKVAGKGPLPGPPRGGLHRRQFCRQNPKAC